MSTIFICHSQSLQAALAMVVDENATKELKEKECANGSIHVDIVEKVPNVCTKGTQKSYQGPSRRSKGNLIDSIYILSSCARQNE